MTKKYKDHYVSISDIKFYLNDMEGNEVENKDGTIKEFQLKNSVRFKPLEYLCESLEVGMLEEIKG